MASDIERIQAYVAGDDGELTDHLKQKYARIKQMCALIMEHMDDTECIAIYCELTQLDASQAYRDLKDARKLAGDVLEVDRRFELLRMYNKQKQLIKKAEDAEQFTAAMSGHRNALLYLEKITEGEMIDLTKYKGQTVILTFDPQLVGDGSSDLPDEDTLKALIEKLSKPKISLDTNDYTEFEEISRELKRGSPGTS